MPAGHALLGGWSCPSPLDGAGRLPRCRGGQAERNPTKIFLLKQMLRKAVGVEPRRWHAFCRQPREPGRHLKVFASASGCQRFPGGLGPPPLPAALCQPPAPHVPGADCNRSQATPKQESPNYPCQTATKGADVTAPLLGMAQPPPRWGLQSLSGAQGFPQPGTWPWPDPPGLKGTPQPTRGTLCCGAQGS